MGFKGDRFLKTTENRLKTGRKIGIFCLKVIVYRKKGVIILSKRTLWGRFLYERLELFF